MVRERKHCGDLFIKTNTGEFISATKSLKPCLGEEEEEEEEAAGQFQMAVLACPAAGWERGRGCATASDDVLHCSLG